MTRAAGVVLRRATRDDTEALCGLQKASALAGFSHIFPPDRYPFPDAAERELWEGLISSEDLTILIAEIDQGPVGAAVFGPEELLRLFVVPERWGTGVADVLHAAVLESMRERGDSLCRLWVLEENKRARRFYEKRGWALDGRTRSSPFPPNPPSLGYTRKVEQAWESPR